MTKPLILDTQLALESTKFVRKITESEPLASYVVGPHEPSANVTSDDDWLKCVKVSLDTHGCSALTSSSRYIKTFLGTIYHPMGTAAMLPRQVGGECQSTYTFNVPALRYYLPGVVDPATLKVYGTTNLRVVDASVIPMLLGTHPQASIYAIAERVSGVGLRRRSSCS